MRARSSGSGVPVFMRSLFSFGLILLFVGGYAVMAAPAELQPPQEVRALTTPVSGLKPPVAGISADIVAGPVPLTVRFTDTSLNNPTSWSWDLNGDGKSESAISNPEYTYSVPGSYTVRLTVANRAGNDTLVYQGFITAAKASPGPVAGFSAYPLQGTVPLTVRFTDESQTNPAAWWWDFDSDGQIDSRESDPVWTYTKAGIYTVRLSVSSDTGKDDLLKEGLITVIEPVTTRSAATTRTVPVPATSPPPTLVTLPLPDTPAASPGFSWLAGAIIVITLLAAGYLVMRGRTSRIHQGEDGALHFELTGGIDYGADTGDDLLDTLLEELEERGEGENDGRP